MDGDLTILRWPDPQGRWAVDGSLDGGAVAFTRTGEDVTGFDLLNPGHAPIHYERPRVAADLPPPADVTKTAPFPEALHFTGTLTIGTLEGTVDVVAASGGRIATTVAIATTRERTVSDGRSGWTTKADGVRELRGAFPGRATRGRHGGPKAALAAWFATLRVPPLLRVSAVNVVPFSP